MPVRTVNTCPVAQFLLDLVSHTGIHGSGSVQLRGKQLQAAGQTCRIHLKPNRKSTIKMASGLPNSVYLSKIQTKLRIPMDVEVPKGSATLLPPRHRKSAKTKASVTSPEPSGSEWAWYRGKSALAICALAQTAFAESFFTAIPRLC